MSLERDLDRAIEAGLRDQTRRGPCPSMDVVAAYCERTLGADELARWEEHFAGCRYCQQILASIARVEPVVQPAEEPSMWARAFDWRWLVPATAAATAVTFWIAIRPSHAPEPSAAPPVAQRFAAPAQEKAEERAAAATAPEPVAPLKKEVAKAAAPVLPPTEPTDRMARRDAPAVGQAAGASVPATPPAPPAAAPAPEMKARANLAETVALADVGADRQAGVHIAQNVRVRWRVGPGGQVARSRDEGATWESHDTGASRDLIAGSAPSDTVFWVVGRSGAILRTTDGQSFAPVESPATSDIVSVLATSELSAAIVTADQQRFTTSDGGKTWQKQE